MLIINQKAIKFLFFENLSIYIGLKKKNHSWPKAVVVEVKEISPGGNCR